MSGSGGTRMSSSFTMLHFFLYKIGPGSKDDHDCKATLRPKDDVVGRYMLLYIVRIISGIQR